jgi:hypothetical protein
LKVEGAHLSFPAAIASLFPISLGVSSSAGCFPNRSLSLQIAEHPFCTTTCFASSVPAHHPEADPSSPKDSGKAQGASFPARPLACAFHKASSALLGTNTLRPNRRICNSLRATSQSIVRKLTPSISAASCFSTTEQKLHAFITSFSTSWFTKIATSRGCTLLSAVKS